MNRQKGLKQMLLIKTGSTIKQIRPRYRDFEDWFAEYMGISGFVQVDVYRQQALPDPESVAGILITGSPAMVSDKEDWSERTAAWLKIAIMQGIPVLGVCYGHQLLAHALGGKVGKNPRGRQIGTVQARLNQQAEDDRLLGALPETFSVQTSHVEAVLDLPPTAIRLASSPRDNNFAVRFADNAWGIQFHPEFSEDVMLEYIRHRADALRAEGLDPDYLQSQVQDTPQAHQILTGFKAILEL